MRSLDQALTHAKTFLTPSVLFALSAVSIIMIVASVLALPLVLCRLPADYFNHEKPHLLTRIKTEPTRKALLLIGKNFIGFILFLAGFLMLFLPGQGLLTILIGLVLMDFPGKYAIERAIVKNPKALHGINWLRTRRGYPPMNIK